MGGERDPREIMQETEIWSYKRMVYAPTRICREKWDAETPMEF